jgi:hypothetical protein
MHLKRAYSFFFSIICLQFVFWFGIQTSYGQSNYYWAQNFNTESSLLAGAVVGGDAGPSAVYYNPALINQDESHKFALSANLLSFQSMSIDNLAGSGTEYDKFILQIQPKFLSYAGSPKNNPKITYEFAFLVPLNNNVKFSYYYHDTLDIIKRLDGNEDYVGEIVYKNEYDDYYIGGGLSYNLSDRFTIGASLFVSYKDMEYRTNLALKAMQDTDTVYSQGIPEPFYFAQNTYSEQLKYWDISLILKLGLHYQSPNGNWGLGLNITLPNISIYGEGDVKKEFYRSDVFNDSTGQFTENLAFVNLQEDVRTKIKDPFSVAFGLQYKTPNRKNAIFFTTEYFLAIDPYAMLKTTNTDVVGNLQPENVGEAMNFYTSANAVLNVGVGFVQYINDELTINGGFKTDFNSLTGNEQKIEGGLNSQPTLSDLYFDKFHIIVGPSLSVKKFGIVLGIQYTWGRADNLYNMANLSEAVEFNPETNQALQGVRQENMKLSYNEISIFFGVTYGFGQ